MNFLPAYFSVVNEKRDISEATNVRILIIVCEIIRLFAMGMPVKNVLRLSPKL